MHAAPSREEQRHIGSEVAVNSGDSPANGAFATYSRAVAHVTMTRRAFLAGFSNTYTRRSQDESETR
jgi:hypothetical protein